MKPLASLLGVLGDLCGKNLLLFRPLHLRRDELRDSGDLVHRQDRLVLVLRVHMGGHDAEVAALIKLTENWGAKAGLVNAASPMPGTAALK